MERTFFPNNAGVMPPSRAYQKQYAYNADKNLEYEGWARSGVATSDAKWVIKKYTYNADKNVETETFASGNVEADKDWTARAGYTYA